jgi:hypothetical protein
MGWGGGIKTLIVIIILIVPVYFLYLIYKACEKNNIEHEQKITSSDEEKINHVEDMQYEEKITEIEKSETLKKICDCGEPLKEDQKFCIICGATLK